jgi:uncharacterized protein (DUF1330 family)
VTGDRWQVKGTSTSHVSPLTSHLSRLTSHLSPLTLNFSLLTSHVSRGAPLPAYVIVQVTVGDPVAYERYKQLAQDAVAAYGGRYIVRGGATTVLEGTWQPSRLVVLEFPDAERARAWWHSPEYAPGKALRQSCAETEMLLVDGMLPSRA